jgi:uncharacterized membrane protein YbaN (DUF454 family)
MTQNDKFVVIAMILLMGAISIVASKSPTFVALVIAGVLVILSFWIWSHVNL